MLDLAIDLDQGTTIRVWRMEEDLEQFATEQDLIEDFDHLSAKRKKEKVFVNHLLQLQLPGERISHEESGKPYLTNQPDMGISISHTGNYASLMLSKENKNIGIDIEKNDTAKVLRVRHKFMTEKEVSLHPTNDEGTDALLAWTTKEALFKLATPPHYDFIGGFEITSSTISGNKGYSHVTDLISHATYRVEHEIHPDYVMTYVIQ